VKIPSGHTEKSVLDAVAKSVNVLAASFVFGPYEREDIEQQCYLFSFEVLEKEKYDPALPLENFLYIHIRNRLCNFRRDKLRRNDAPCLACHGGNPCQPGGQQCEKYAVWFERNQAKSNLMRPLDLSNIADEHEKHTRVESTVVEDAEIKETLTLIDRLLPVELRSTYLKMRASVPVPKDRRLEVEAAIREIVGDI
jgi:hypothetical protein